MAFKFPSPSEKSLPSIPFMDMEGMLGKDFSDGLGNLKAILEK